MRTEMSGFMREALRREAARQFGNVCSDWPDSDTTEDELLLDGVFDVKRVAEDVDACLDELRRACSTEASVYALTNERAADKGRLLVWSR